MKRLSLLNLGLLCSLPCLALANHSPIPTYQYYVKSLVDVPKASANGINEWGAMLGEGYSNDRTTPTVMCIVDGKTKYAGTAKGLVDIVRHYTLDEIKNQLELNVKGDVTISLFSAGASVDFVHNSQEDDYSESFLYRTSIELRDSVYDPPAEGDILNRVGKAYQNDGDKFRYYCGDSYVNQFHWGGYLYVSLNMKFHSTEDKQIFDAEAHGSYGSIADLSGNLHRSVEKIHKDGTISIRALQVGGDPTKLGKILGGGGGVAPVVTCSFDHLDQCQQLINNIIIYATSSKDDNFPTQIKIGGEDISISAAPIEMRLLDYSFLGVPISAPSVVTPEIKAARKHLAELQQQNVNDTQRANFLISVSAASEPYTRKVKQVLSDLTDNYAAINRAGISCFTDPKTCVITAKDAEANLKPIDRNVLKGPFNVYKKVKFTTIPIYLSRTDPIDFTFKATGLNQGAKTVKIIELNNAEIYYRRPAYFTDRAHFTAASLSSPALSSDVGIVQSDGSAEITFHVYSRAMSAKIVENGESFATFDITTQSD